MGQKVRPLDKTSLSISDKIIVERFTTILSPEQVLYSLKGFLLNNLEIMFESSITGLCTLLIVGRLMSVIKGISSGFTKETTVGLLIMSLFNGVLGKITSLFFDVLKIGNSFEAVFLGKKVISSSSTF